MSHPPTFSEAVDLVDELSLEDQEALVELLQRRLLEQRRQDLVRRVEEAEQEFRDGKGKMMSVDELMREITS